jgi:hypothetical protein
MHETSSDDEQMRSLLGFADDVASMPRVHAKLPCELLTMLVFGGESLRAGNSIHPQGGSNK